MTQQRNKLAYFQKKTKNKSKITFMFILGINILEEINCYLILNLLNILKNNKEYLADYLINYLIFHTRIKNKLLIETKKLS